jgi:predicted amidohydrolase
VEALEVGIGVAQLTLRVGASDQNLERTVAAIAAAAKDGANLVVLPELASSGYDLSDWEAARSASEPIPGPTTEAWEKQARTSRCFVAGGVCERQGDSLYNSVALVGPDGLRGVYRKLHLFDREHFLFAPGDLGLPVFQLPFGRVGLLVCYDLRFVEAMRILSLLDADLVAVPSAWTGGFDPSPPPDGVIDQVRAAAVQSNLCQVFTAAASQPGRDRNVTFLGSSTIISPYGRFLAGPADREGELVHVEKVDLADARRARVRDQLIAPRADRRTDVYGDLLGYRG